MTGYGYLSEQPDPVYSRYATTTAMGLVDVASEQEVYGADAGIANILSALGHGFAHRINGAVLMYPTVVQTVGASTEANIAYDTFAWQTSDFVLANNTTLQPLIPGYYLSAMGVYVNGNGNIANTNLSAITLYKNTAAHRRFSGPSYNGVQDAVQGGAVIVQANGTDTFYHTFNNPFGRSRTLGTGASANWWYMQFLHP